LMLSKKPEERPEIPAIVNSIKKELQRTGAQRDAVVVPTAETFQEKQPEEGFWADKLLSETETRKHLSYTGIAVDRSIAIKNLQCLLLSSDKTLSKLVELSLKEYGFKFKLTNAIENLGNLSSDSLTIAWFIDLDNILQGVEEIAYMARKVAPEAKLVFLCSYFTRELAEQCVQQKATSLLVKPILVPLLTLTINSLCQEPELFDGQDLIPATAEPKESLGEKTDDHYLQNHLMCCPICSENFETMRFKSWLFPVHGTDTDFCPICPEGVLPEMHSIAVCPKCFYANTTGRFGRLNYDEEECASFLEKSKVEARRKVALDLDFRERRNLLAGIKSYELAVMTLAELQTSRLDKLAGEFHLKVSWLCRRMGQRLKEQEFQSKALECFMRLYHPYLSVYGKYPSREKIQSKLKPYESPLKERIIIVIGFLSGEISRRLKLFDHAKFYFQEVMRLPFAPSYPVLLRGIDTSNNLLESERKLLMHG